MIGNRGIDQEVQNKVDAYRGNPNALAQKYQQNQQLIDLLALQKLKSEKESAAREMQMQMGGQQMPTVAEARENEVLDLTKQELAQNTSGAMQQQQAQKQQAAKELVDRSAQMPIQSQSPMVQGVAGLPAPNMAPKAMATGGIVAFERGGQAEADEMDPKLNEEMLRLSQARQETPRAESREAPARAEGMRDLAQRGIRTLIGDKTPAEIFKERTELGTTAAGYSPEERAIIQRQIADRAAYDARMYSPEQQRSEALTRFLLGGAGRTGIGSVLGGAGAAAENYRSSMREGDRERMIERQKQEQGLVDVGPAARLAGLNLGKESERSAITGLAQGTGDATKLLQIAEQAAARGDTRKAADILNSIKAAEGRFDNNKKIIFAQMKERGIEPGTPESAPYYEQINQIGKSIYDRLQVPQYFVPDPVPGAPVAPAAATPGFLSMLRNGMTPNFGGGSNQPAPRPRTSGAVDPSNPLLRTN